MKLVTIIPCYNEAERLPVEDFLAFIDGGQYSGSILFVNDGSSDNTLEVLKSLAEKRKDAIKVLDLPQNVGKGEAIRHGFLHAFSNIEFDYAGFLDADLSAPLQTVDQLAEYAGQHENPGMIFGSRVALYGYTDIERKTSRHYIGRVIATLISNILHIPVYDTQCGAKLIRKDLIKELCSNPFYSRWLFDVEMIMRYRTKHDDLRSQLLEVPLKQWHEKGDSRLTILDGLRIPFQLLSLKRKYKDSF